MHVSDRKLQGARLQGAYVPGMQRRPVAVAMHYLAPKPFQMLDALQDSLSYEEDMDWEPTSRVMILKMGLFGKLIRFFWSLGDDQ